MRSTLLACMLACCVLAHNGRAAEKPTGTDPDEWVFEVKGKPHDTPALVAYLNERSNNDDDLVGIATLIKGLGSDRPRERDLNYRKLVALKLTALPYLRDALKHSDLDVARLAKKCILDIPRDSTTIMFPPAAVKLLVKRRVPEAVATLLHYLPYTTDPDVEEEIYYSLNGMAVKDGKIEPLLIKAMEDRVPARRAVAGCIVARIGSEEERKMARQLLEDKDAYVRLRTAQGFLARTDPSGIPALIGLLQDKSIPIAWQAQELLFWFADETAPRISIGSGATDAKIAASDWKKWWDDHRGRLPTAESRKTKQKPCLLFTISDKNHGILCGMGMTPRWTFPSTKTTRILSLTPDGRIIASERQGERKTFGDGVAIGQYTLDGKLLESVPWHKARDPESCWALSNGWVLVAEWTDLFCIDNFLSVQLEKMLRGPEPGSQTIISPSKMHGGILICMESPNRELEAIRLVDPGSGVTLKRYPIKGPARRRRTSTALDCRQLFVADNENKLSIHYYETGVTGPNKIAVPKEIDLKQCSIQQFRDGNLLFKDFSKQIAAEFDSKNGHSWFMEGPKKNLNFNVYPAFKLLRFGF